MKFKAGSPRQLGSSKEGSHLVFWVPLPPPYSGPIVASGMLMKALKEILSGAVIANSTVRKTVMSKGRFDVMGLMMFARSYIRFLSSLLPAKRRVLYMIIAPGLVGFLRDAVLIWTAVLLRKRIVLHLRGGNYANFYQSSGGLVRFLIKRSWGLADIGIVQSDCLRNLLSAAAPKVRIAVIPNGLPIDKAAPFVRRPKDRNEVNILFLAYLSYNKGFNDLINVHKALVMEDFPVRLTFAGEIPRNGRQLSTFLSGRAKEYFEGNLAELEADVLEFVSSADKWNAVYRGVVFGEEKESVLRNADLFVLPSYMEGFSMAILEAMWAGLPIVTTTVGSNPDIIIDGVNGFLVTPGDLDALRSAISTLVRDSDLRESMGRRNKELVRSNYSIDLVARRMAEIVGGL